MTLTSNPCSSRRLVDYVTDELVLVLGDRCAYEFRPLFTKVWEGLKHKNLASGSEEMMRLRLYEKLLNLSKRGFVRKTGKAFTGLANLHEAGSAHKLAAAASKAAPPAKV